ncbi:D-glycero-beta-D-manno-heptose 1-phosphate adenylyltransferase [Streptomyces sp. NPDC018031]|uniref:D-glycero-beta-D-manno-heptose 1-phosphate adenylyltransferase n=1 Tax=Streptomyces sp. NPDC018031 TaxID=3365033 RepID=UPI0037B32B1B
MTRQRPLVVIGDTLLDQDIDGTATRLAPDAPAPVVEVRSDHSRPGGAGLAAWLAARSGNEVVLITGIGEGEAADRVRAALSPAVHLVELPYTGTLPVKTRVMADGRPLVRVDRGHGSPGPPGGQVRAVLREARAVLVADYGRGTATAVRELLGDVARRVPLVWDPHPRGGPPVAGARLATPNAGEARTLAAAGHPPGGTGGDALRDHGRRGARLAEHWGCAAVTVTLGERGAILARPGEDNPMYVPAPQIAPGDPCGAGDRFAATAAGALADGALPEEAVQRAVGDAARFVADGGAAAPGLWETPAPDATAGSGPRETPDARTLAERVRARGGTVVATGGCFDLLHAGHVGLLQNARRVGDCLIVCVNSDASVRRLKGPGRPLTPVADRVSVLAGLGCVDAVAVFDEDTPERLLRGLRPDVWVKGGDYTLDELPEAVVLREWNGQALVLPYLDGRSTTELARRAALSPTARQASR